MYSVMMFQVLLRGKALSTCFTHKRPFPYSKDQVVNEKTKAHKMLVKTSHANTPSKTNKHTAIAMGLIPRDKGTAYTHLRTYTRQSPKDIKT